MCYNVGSLIAGWSSLVARRAHNPKVASSNLAPATKIIAGLSRCESTGSSALEGVTISVWTPRNFDVGCLTNVVIAAPSGECCAWWAPG